jgi:hypothetical protein
VTEQPEVNGAHPWQQEGEGDPEQPIPIDERIDTKRCFVIGTTRASRRLPRNMPPMKLAKRIPSDRADAPMTSRNRWNQTIS